MKFNTVAKAKLKAESILGIFFLMCLLSGCVSYVSQAGNSEQCNKVQDPVNKAEKEYNDAIQELNKNPKDENASKNVAAKTKNLGDLQENASQVCNRVK